MNIIKTLQNNWRDIVAGFTIAIVAAFLADTIERWALTDSGATWLNNVVILIRGVSRFAMANLAAFMFVAIAWPTVNKFNNDHFITAWQNLPQWGRLTSFLGLAAVYVIAASLCFAA